jgi:hypothetical protein
MESNSNLTENEVNLSIKELLKIINNKKVTHADKIKAKNELKDKGFKIEKIKSDIILSGLKLKKEKASNEDIIKALAENNLTVDDSEEVINEIEKFRKNNILSFIFLPIGIFFLCWGIYEILTTDAVELAKGIKAFGVGGLLASGVILIIQSLIWLFKKSSSIIIYRVVKS